jgi:aspartokinase/homoserine dehydrogenase 1
LNVFAIAILRLLNKTAWHQWKNEIQTNGFSYTIDDVIAYANEHHLENLIAIDKHCKRWFCYELHFVSWK